MSIREQDDVLRTFNVVSVREIDEVQASDPLGLAPFHRPHVGAMVSSPTV
jgi:hypothetical protein